MSVLGAHMSIAGGLHKAVEAAAALKMDTVQIFTHSPSQWAVHPVDVAVPRRSRSANVSTRNHSRWRAAPLAPAVVRAFRQELEQTGVASPLSHSSYLLNLATPDDELHRRSVDGFVNELQRACELGIFGVVLHPGAAMGATEAAAIRRIVQGLNEALRQTRGSDTLCLLETTAGQGSSIGHRFEQLARILDRVRDPARMGVCIDTCHVFAAGYDLRTPKAYEQTMTEFDRVVGIAQVRALHLNDSKRELGSRVDRHEHIGEGQLGRGAFRSVLRDPRWEGIPMVLETPKGEKRGKNLDGVNLQRLRRLAQP